MPFEPLEAREEDLQRILSELGDTTIRMRSLARMIVGILGVGVLLAIFLQSFQCRDDRGFSSEFARLFSTLMGLFVMAPAAMGIWFLTRFEALRRHGEVLFEELSNELQWQGVRGTGPSGPTGPGDRPEIHKRIVLRSFIQASDLPLVPGKFGPTVYFLLFVVIAVAGILLPRLLLH